MKKTALVSGLALLTAAVGLSISHSNTTQAATPDKTATVNYVTGYGIATWGNVQTNPNVTGHYLGTSTQWLVNTTVRGTNGRLWYLVGNNEWASEQYYDLGNENSSQSLDATITINYKTGAYVNVWTSPAMTGTNGQVKHGTDYKTTQRQVVNGKSWYQIGANQWISGDYAYIKNEASRGQKTFSNATVIPQQSSTNYNNAGTYTKNGKTYVNYSFKDLPKNYYDMTTKEGYGRFYRDSNGDLRDRNANDGIVFDAPNGGSGRPLGGSTDQVFYVNR